MFKTIQEGLQAVQKQICGEVFAEQGLYVPAQGKYSALSDEKSFALTPVIKKFASWNDAEATSVDNLWSSSLKVLLLLGDAGSGKSVFGQELMQRLWKAYKAGQPMPLWINLPQLQNPLRRAIEETLEGYGFNATQIAQLKCEQTFFFFLDGYDELHQWQNLYVTNRLNEWQAKTVITCRSQALYGVQDVDKYFMPFEREKRRPELLCKVTVAPFTSAQIETYLQQFNTSQKLKIPITRVQLENIPGLSQLITTPFLLHLVAESLPEIQKQYRNRVLTEQKNFTQARLYDVFIEQWFQRQEVKLKTSGHIPEHQDPKPQFWRYCQRLAQQMYLQQTSLVTYQPSGRGGLFDTKQATTSTWAVFFETDKETAQVRSACPLKQYVQHRYGFWHASLIEYFVTHAVYVQAIIPTVIEKIEEKSEDGLYGPAFLHQKLFTKNINMIRFLADRIEESEVFKEILFKIIEYSKTDERYAIGAANSITSLNAGRVNLSGRDFNKIRIPEADLSGALLDSTLFQEANLREVNFQDAWLQQASFRRANLESLRFGKWPSIQIGYKNRIQSCCYSRDGKLFAMTEGGRIGLYNAAASSLIKYLGKDSNAKMMKSIAFDVTGKYLAAGGGDYDSRNNDPKKSSWTDTAIRLWHVETGELLRTFDGITDGITNIAFDSTGKYLISGGTGYRLEGSQQELAYLIFWWEVSSGKLMRTIDESIERTLSIASDTRGKYLASGHGNGSVGKDGKVHIWHAASGRLLHILSGTAERRNGAVNSVAFDVAGERLASGHGNSSYETKDNTVRLWDTASGKLLYAFEGHNERITSVAFDVANERLVSGSEDNTVRLWDIASGNLLRIFKEQSKVFCVDFHPSGECLAVGSYDGVMTLLNVRSGHSLRPFERKFPVALKKLALSTTGEYLAAVAFDDATISVWYVATGKLLRTFEGYIGQVNSVAFDPTSEHLASGHGYPGYQRDKKDNTVRLWHMASGKLLRTFDGYTAKVNNVAFNSTGTRLAAAFGDDNSDLNDNTVRLWHVASGNLLGSFEGHKGPVMHVSFDATGDRVISQAAKKIPGGASYDDKYQWEVASGKCLNISQSRYDVADTRGERSASVREMHNRNKGEFDLLHAASGQLLRIFKGHTERGMSFSFDVSGEYLASASDDKTICLWHVASGRVLKQLKLSEASGIIAWKETKEGSFLSICIGNSTVAYFKVNLNADCYSFSLQTLISSVPQLRCDNLDLTDAQLDEITCQILRQHGAKKDSVADTTIVISGEKKLVDQNEALRSKSFVVNGHTAPVLSVALDATGKYFASGSEDKTVRLWEILSGKCLYIFEAHTNTVTNVVFDPTSKFLASGSSDTNIHLWDMATGHWIRSLIGHATAVTSIVFNATGKYLASVGNSRKICLWDVASGQCHLKLLKENEVQQTVQGNEIVKNEGYVNSIAFDPTGKWLVSGNDNGLMHWWDVGSGVCLRTCKENTSVMSIAFNSTGEYLASGHLGGCYFYFDQEMEQKRKTILKDKHYYSAYKNSYVYLENYNPRYTKEWKSQILYIKHNGEYEKVKITKIDLFDVLYEKRNKNLGKYLDHVHLTHETIKNLITLNGGHAIPDKTLCLWSSGGTIIPRTLEGKGWSVTSIAFDTMGKRLASGSEDGSLKVFEVASGCLLTQQILPQPVRSLAWKDTVSGSFLVVAFDKNIACFQEKERASGNSFILKMLVSTDRELHSANLDFIGVQGLEEKQPTQLKQRGASTAIGQHGLFAAPNRDSGRIFPEESSSVPNVSSSCCIVS